MKRIIFALLFIPLLVSAQGFNLGFDFEPGYIRIIHGNKSQPLGGETEPPIALTIIPGYNFNKRLALRGHIGYTFLSFKFSGFEIGLDGRYSLNKKAYVIASFRHHLNEPNSAGDRKSTRLNSSHIPLTRMPYSA